MIISRRASYAILFIAPCRDALIDAMDFVIAIQLLGFAILVSFLRFRLYNTKSRPRQSFQQRCRYGLSLFHRGL